MNNSKPICRVKPFLVLIKCFACNKPSENKLCDECSIIFNGDLNSDLSESDIQESEISLESDLSDNDNTTIYETSDSGDRSDVSEYLPSDVEESTSESETLYSTDTLSNNDSDIIIIESSSDTEEDS